MSWRDYDDDYGDEEDYHWEDDVPDWWWDSAYVDAADYEWNEARYLEWCGEIEWLQNMEA